MMMMDLEGAATTSRRGSLAEQMPNELLAMLFAYLPAQTLLVCRQVCWRWMEHAKSPMNSRFRLRLTSRHAAHLLATEPHTRWLFHLQHRVFVCTGNNWSKTPAWHQWFGLPYSSEVLSVNVLCSCRTIGGWSQPRVCILNRDWTAYVNLKQFNLLAYPAPAGPVMADAVDQVDDPSIWGWPAPGLAWLQGVAGASFLTWPLRSYYQASDVGVPENPRTFPLLTLPQLEHCTLAMDTVNPDNVLPSWEAYNLNFGRLFTTSRLLPRIAQLKSFTGWYWVYSSHLIIHYERQLLAALATSYPQHPHPRHITLYFTPSNPSWPACCPDTRKTPLVCGLAADFCSRCYHNTHYERAQHRQHQARARAEFDTVLVLRAGTRANLFKSLHYVDNV